MDSSSDAGNDLYEIGIKVTLVQELNQAFRRNSYKMQQTNEKKREKKCRERITEYLELPPPYEMTLPKNVRKISMTTPQISIQEQEETARKLSDNFNNRRRKTADEIQLLEKCFVHDEEWTKDTVEFIKANSHLTYTQIYKWGWDQKK